MTRPETPDHDMLARLTGVAIIVVLLLGITTSVFVTGTVNINLEVDSAALVGRMADAVGSVYARAWISLAFALLDLLIAAGLYRLLRVAGPTLALWSLLAALLGATLVAQSGLQALTVAALLDSAGLRSGAPEALDALQVGFLAGDYAAFHAGLVVNAAAKAGFFLLLLRARAIPAWIAGWGLVATVFVAVAIVGRDFVPALGRNAVTLAFMLANLSAHVLLGGWLIVRGVRGPLAR